MRQVVYMGIFIETLKKQLTGVFMSGGRDFVLESNLIKVRRLAGLQ